MSEGVLTRGTMAKEAYSCSTTTEYLGLIPYNFTVSIPNTTIIVLKEFLVVYIGFVIESTTSCSVRDTSFNAVLA
jgi:hypothetical protein